MMALPLIWSTPASALATAEPGFSATTYAAGIGVSPAGVTFINSTLYAVDPLSGDLFRASAGATPFGAMPATRLAALGNAPTGITSFGGQLYVSRAGVTPDIVRVDPITGAALTIVPPGTLSCPNGIAADPVSGDLFVAGCDFVWRIVAPGLPQQTVSVYIAPYSGFANYGIAVALDRTLFVTVPGLNEVFKVQGPSQLAVGQSPTAGPIATIAGIRGVAATPGFVFVTTTGGDVVKVPVPGATAVITSIPALTGGDRGDLATAGPDGCVYASQGPTVVRLADANGTCFLASAAPPPPPPSLTLTRISSNQPLIGNGAQTFVAALTVPGGSATDVPVSFTVTRGSTIQSYQRLTGPNGEAILSYEATTIGTDIISASVVLNGITVTSNAITIVWPRARDTIPPTITYTVTTTPAGGVGANFSCPSPILGTLGVAEFCGWYTSPPTVHWTVIATGLSGLDQAHSQCPPFTLNVSSPVTGTPVTCNALNGDGVSATLNVTLQALLVAPTITATARTADATIYTGAPTNQDVTVSFACASDPALGSEAIRNCGPTQTVSAEGPRTVTGSVLDVAGTTRIASVPVLIDKTAPTVSIAGMRTADGAVYAGAPTRQSVTVTFACLDALDPHPICPAPVVVTAGPSVTASGVDWAGNSQPYTFSGLLVDQVAPTATATVSPRNPDLTSTLNATVVLAATDPSGVASITYSASGAQPISATTVSGATTTVWITAVGLTILTYIATDAVGNQSPPQTVRVQVTSLIFQPTQFVVWGGNPGGVQVGQRVVFWGEHWWDQTQIPEKSRVRAFKGWAGLVGETTWSTKPGNSKPPEALPAYISVIVTSSIERSGSSIGGTISGHAVLLVDSRYRDEPGKPVSGVVVALTP